MSNTSIARASAMLAGGTVAGAVVGFAYDSAVVVVLGPGAVTDAYFLSLGVISFLPTLFYIAATNVLAPLISARTGGRRSEHAAAFGWLAISAIFSGLVLAFRELLSGVLSGNPMVQQSISDALFVLAPLSMLSGLSEFRRARLLANGQYGISGTYVLARNLVTVMAAVIVRPDSAADLGLCLLIGYAGQAIAVQIVAIPARGRAQHERPEHASLALLALAGLASQGLIFAIGYAPVLFERALSGRLAEGLPTIMSYSYRIVAMLGSVAITSATVPGVAKLASDLARGSAGDATHTLQQVFSAASRLAIPAIALLGALSLPAAQVLASESRELFALVLAAYGLSLLPLTYLRSWSALQYARGHARPVVFVTAAQSVATMAFAGSAMYFGAAALAIAPLAGGVAGVVTAKRLSADADRSLLQQAIRFDLRWMGACLAVGAVAALVGFSVLAWRTDRAGGILACAVVGVVFAALAWSGGVIGPLPRSARPGSVSP